LRRILAGGVLLLMLFLLLSRGTEGGTLLDQTGEKLDSLGTIQGDLRQELEDLDRREQESLRELDRQQRRISAARGLIASLEEEQRLLSIQMAEHEGLVERGRLMLDSLDRELSLGRADRDTLRRRTRRLALRLFRHRRQDPLFWLLSSGNAAELLRRLRLFPWLYGGLEERLAELEFKEERVGKLRLRTAQRREDQQRHLRSLADSRERKVRGRDETRQTLDRLSEDREARQRMLGGIREDRRLGELRAEELRAASDKVSELLRNLELQWKRRESQMRSEADRRQTLVRKLGEGGPAGSAAGDPARADPPPAGAAIQSENQGAAGELRDRRGRLPRPAEGRLIRPYGLQRDGSLGTVLDNPGADYSCELNTPVRLVHGGRIVRIAWIPGFGNTLLVDHGRDAYTVYAKLEEVQVREGQVLPAGAPLGIAGSFDEGGRASLHFELWLGRESQDPESWFR